MSNFDAQGHRERLRERYLSGGLDSFQDHEVLEFLLTCYLPRIDTKPIAKRLLRQFGTIYRVLEAKPEDLMKVQGVGEKTAFALSMLPGIFRRYSLDRAGEQKTLLRRREMGEYCASLFIGERYEISRLVLLNNSGGLLHEEMISRGTIDQVALYARNIVELALRHGAKYAVIAHNHPGGSPEPSAGDIEVTSAVKKALEAIEVSLLDHIIVTAGGFVSVRDYAQEHTQRQSGMRLAKPYPEEEARAAEKGKNG